MKKLIILFIGLISMSNLSMAQTTENIVAEKTEFQRYMDAKLAMDYRKNTIEALNLTSEEIEAFDPVYMEYMDKREVTMKQRVDLIEDFKEELAENDSEKNENEDRADFIEDYWEIEIAESELRKDFYDKLEDKIDKDKAAKFFLWEGVADYTISNNAISDVLPATFDLKKYGKTDNTTWKETNNSMNKVVKIDSDVSDQDYKKYIDAKMQMDFRNETIRVLELPSEKIAAFDTFLKGYLQKKEMLLEKRMDLLEDYRDEIAEDDSPANEAEDKADFIEDYWEIEIAEMELRKDQFDILEDMIAKEKAAKFFFWEDAIENRIAWNNLVAMLPTITIFDIVEETTNTSKEEMKEEVAVQVNKPKSISLKTKTQIESFDKWFNEHKGQVDIHHEYTSNGLTSLVNTMESLKMDMEVNIPQFATTKAMILRKANELTVDWKSTNHADMTKEAFIASAELMANFDQLDNQSTNLKALANSIDEDVLMTKQADKIYQFFDAANTRFQQIYRNNMTSSK